MPNWCESRLEVTGSPECVEQFFESFAANGFAAVVPEPRDVIDPKFDLEAWRVEHWGTKWNISSDDWRIVCEAKDDGMSTIYLAFSTAWGPPLEWLIAVAEAYRCKKISFWLSYLEPGMGFSGAVEHYCEHMDKDQ